jgi:hypothetical protein
MLPNKYIYNNKLNAKPGLNDISALVVCIPNYSLHMSFLPNGSL